VFEVPVSGAVLPPGQLLLPSLRLLLIGRAPHLGGVWRFGPSLPRSLPLCLLALVGWARRCAWGHPRRLPVRWPPPAALGLDSILIRRGLLARRLGLNPRPLGLSALSLRLSRPRLLLPSTLPAPLLVRGENKDASRKRERQECCADSLDSFHDCLHRLRRVHEGLQTAEPARQPELRLNGQNLNPARPTEDCWPDARRTRANCVKARKR
jgi:hypothetical protein